MKNEGFKLLNPQYMGEITPKNEGNVGSHGRGYNLPQLLHRSQVEKTRPWAIWLLPWCWHKKKIAGFVKRSRWNVELRACVVVVVVVVVHLFVHLFVVCCCSAPILVTPSPSHPVFLQRPEPLFVLCLKRVKASERSQAPEI